MGIFERYAPFVQDFVYRNGWTKLRGVQVAAGDVLFNTDDHLLLCASTASGKTEAAFFPILSEFAANPPKSIGCLYIAPLKALINDQFERLTALCEEGGIPVTGWHGDVSRSRKERLIRKPAGILQITPESLEAMLMHRHSQLPRLFGDLRYVVIDEIHSFLRSDRGGQMLCLIDRLCRGAGCRPRRIGLSATVGDPAAVGAFLAAGTDRKTAAPKVSEGAQRWRLTMEHFYVTDPQADPEAQDDAPRPATDRAPELADRAIGYVFEHTRGRKCLVFCNSREECEVVTATMRQYCAVSKQPDRFLIHHGNLSAPFRESAEEIMKEEDSTASVCTTATLELGIDVGRLEQAFQFNAPFTVSSFLQRMGRTGRRGEPPEMWFVMREEHPFPRAEYPTSVPWPLLQGIALVQLYAEEKWVEPPRERRLPYGLLYHQTMSTLASRGEMSPARLAEMVLTLPVFHNISQDDFRELLLHLLEKDHVQRTERGGLIFGIAGERVVGDYHFYAVFCENEEYGVRSESEEVGTVVSPPPVGDRLALAGRVWEVEEVDRTRHLVYCHRVEGVVPANFGDVAGDIDTKILERMRRVLSEDTVWPYLQHNARARLAMARRAAAAAGVPGRVLLHLGERSWCLLPWLGTYAFLAMERFLRLRCGARLGLKKFQSVRPYYMLFQMAVSEDEFWTILDEELAKGVDPMELLFDKETPVFEKYDEFLPDSLVRKGFALGVLDLDGMIHRIRAERQRAGEN